MLSVVLFYALLASVFTIGKQVVLYVQPFFLTGIRLAPSGALILLYQYFFKRADFYYQRVCLWWLLGYSLAVFLIDTFRFIALVNIPASNAALISATAPFIAAIASYFFLNESITKRKFFALILGFVGVLPLILSHVSLANLAESGTTITQLIVGYSTAFISVLSLVLGSICIRVLTVKLKYPVMMVAGIATVIGGAIALIISGLCEIWSPVPIINFSQALPLMGWLFVMHNLIAYPLYTYLIKKFPVTLVSFAQLATPLFTALFRWFLCGEIVNIYFIFAFIVLSCSFVMFYKEEKKEGLIR